MEVGGRRRRRLVGGDGVGQGGELEIADFVDTCMAVCGQASGLVYGA